MSPLLLVLAILGGVGLLQAAIWIPLVRSWNRKGALYYAALDQELAASGEKTLLGPERATYEGSSGLHSGTRGTGKLMLTDRRLLFRKLTGGVVEIPVKKLKAVRESGSYNGAAVGGNKFLIVETIEPADIGLIVGDREAWKKALESVIAGS